MDEPVLRALTEPGEAYDDPSEDLIFELLRDLDIGASGTFLIVERVADTSGQTYAQALRLDDGRYTVEYREGSADEHFTATVTDSRAAHVVLAGWAFGLRGWRDTATWTRLR